MKPNIYMRVTRLSALPLFDGFLQAGGHTLNTPRMDLSPGMYVIRFHTNDGVQIVKLPVML